jgi:uncharacterized RDD family membrane protein YckC
VNYYINRGGQQYGPYSLEQLQSMRAQGQVDAGDLAWCEGMSSWVPVSQVLGSESAASQAQPPLQQPYVAPAYGGPAGYAAAAAPAYGGMGPAAYASLPYATWASRVMAYLIDFALVVGAMIVLYFVGGIFIGGLASIGRAAGSDLVGVPCCFMLFLFPLATFLVGLYNRVYLVAQRGYSIGQGVMKLKVVDARGNLLSMGTLVIRLIVQALLGMIPIVGILDLLWPLWDVPRQTLHDKAVGSFVINNPAAA